MLSKTVMAFAALTMMAGSALAETYEVKMLNKGEAGSMVFEPDFVAAQPGDTIRFVATDKGHNVESIKGMLPDGVKKFKSKMNKDFDLVVDTEGLYGLKCTPHIGMGMVALIQVGRATNLDEARAVKQRGKAKKRFDAAFSQVK
ncbi:pseudoazurin [Nisaea nitritireducens]|uniref:pseudoazurin n=1 Tax=Nisaea nitritireducens TaxID=568392 RepID=UPI0018679008|nr:pseudoazurin [Nisaea nitritireducens]